MKKFLLFIMLLTSLPLTACKQPYDYTQHLSDLREEIFLAETEEFSLTLSCISCEHPFLSDGIAAERSDYVEITLVPQVYAGETYEIYMLGESTWGGEAAFRSVTGDYFLSRGVSSFPEESVSLRVVKNGGESVRELTATGIRTAETLTATEALACAVEAEKEVIAAMTVSGEFMGEFYVRLLRRDKNYYYVGIIDRTGKTLSLLLNSETGEVLARREAG